MFNTALPTPAEGEATWVDRADTVVSPMPRLTLQLAQTPLRCLGPLGRKGAIGLGSLALAYAGLALLSCAVALLGGVGVVAGILGCGFGAAALVALAPAWQRLRAGSRARLGRLPAALIDVPIAGQSPDAAAASGRHGATPARPGAPQAQQPAVPRAGRSAACRTTTPTATAEITTRTPATAAAHAEVTTRTPAQAQAGRATSPAAPIEADDEATVVAAMQF